MEERFPHIKSQEEIDAKEFGFKWFKWYMILSVTLSVVFYVAVLTAIFKYLLS